MSIPLDSLPVVGALEVELTATGLTCWRLPAWARTQIADPSIGLVTGMPAGVRLRFRTESRSLELDAMLTTLQLGELPRGAPIFDLVVDGEVTGSVTAEDHHTLQIKGPRLQDLQLIPGEQATVRFALPGSRDHVVEIWLPHAAVLELRAARVDDGATLEPVPGEGRRWVHYGSSISHCLEADRPTETWPAVAARRAGLDLVDLGLAGQCQLDPQVARTIRDLEVDLISVKAGINVLNGDTMRERTFRPALHGFLDTVRDGHPETPLLVVTPIHCPSAEDHPGPTVLRPEGVFGVVPRPDELATGSLTLRRIRELVTEVVTHRQAAGDRNLHLLDGLQLFGPDDVALMPDLLHPDAEGYRLMGSRFHDLVMATGPFA
jgi:hypothetical protein